MKGRAVKFRNPPLWLAGSIACCLVVSACCTTEGASRREPKQEIFDQEVVTITVDHDQRKITVEPYSVRIEFQWSSDKQDPLRAVQARWVVKGLEPGHVLHITPKDNAPEVSFPFPGRYGEKPAYSIDAEHNSIVSGEVRSMPGLVKDKGYTDRAKVRRAKGEPYEVVWPYDVTVADRSGKALFNVDPEIIIAGHP